MKIDRFMGDFLTGTNQKAYDSCEPPYYLLKYCI